MTMETLWIPGVNRLGPYGHWAFREFRDVYTMREGFELRSGTHTEFEHVASEFLEEARAEAARSLILAGGSMPDLEYVPRRKIEIWDCSSRTLRYGSTTCEVPCPGPQNS